MFFKTPLLVAATAIGLTAISYPAQAALFNFSYTSSLGTITGQIDGTVQGDNNTVVVSGITNTAFNGIPTTPINGFSAYSPFFTSSPTAPVVSFSGSGMDFIACTDFSTCTSGFGFLPAGISDPNPVFGSGGDFGSVNAGENFNAANWQLTPQSTPEPGTVVALLGLGLGALASRSKKQG